jgi:hypothetical protein
MAFTVSNNSPSAGYIAWSNLTIVYNGVTHSITNGNTNCIYAYWLYSNPTVLTVSNTFPTLTNDDCIIFLNKNGVAVTVPTATVLDGDLIVPGSVLASAIAAATITGDKIAANTVTSNNILAGTITASDIAASTISSNLIAANAIGTAALAADAVTSTQIAANTITAADIAASTITTNQIAANTIVGGDIAASTITGTNIAASTITASLIAANAIGASAIAASAVTADKLSVTSLSAISANLGTITAGTLSAVSITGSSITSQVSGKSDNVNLNGGSFLATAYNAAIDDNGFTDANGGRVTTTIAPTSFKRYISPETASPTYNVDYTFEVTPTKLNMYATRNNYGNSGGIQIDVSKTIPAIQAMPSAGPNSMGKWQIYDMTQINFWESNTANAIPNFKWYDAGNNFAMNYPLSLPNVITSYESHFAAGTYTDPWAGKGAALKASGGMIADWVGGNSFQSKGDFTLTLGNGQYLMANQGSGAVLWRSNYTRLVLHDQDPTCRIERYDGGSANLIVATINGSSDRKKKHKIAPFTSDALSKIKATQVYNYNFKDEPEETSTHLGIMAQEAPTDVVGYEGNTVDLYAMISLSWKAIQELSDELDKLRGGKKNVA